jgi:TPR repeat protein
MEAGLAMARDCRHPDAVWLATLFPPGVAVTRERVLEVMLGQGEDRRALYLACKAGSEEKQIDRLLRRSAELGYAPAQESLSWESDAEENGEFPLAKKAAAQGFRGGLTRLGYCYAYGGAHTRDRHKAMELFRAAAELGCPLGMHYHGQFGFDEDDWQRYYWWERSISSGVLKSSGSITWFLLQSFDVRKSRLLHAVAPLLRGHLDVPKRQLLGRNLHEADVETLQGFLRSHGAMLRRARRAITCWSLTARRLAIAKDIRVMIAKMAWEEVWLWGQK